MRTESPCSENRSKSSSLAWITVITAVGLTATAVILAKHLRTGAVKGRVIDLFNFCDRAADALDERLGYQSVALSQP